MGHLRIINGTDRDAVAVLLELPESLPRRAIYVRSNESGVITQIPHGAYQLQFQLGSSWRTDRRFCEITGTSQFDRSLDFEERRTYDGVEYSTFELTLHPVPLGTARTHSIPVYAFELLPP